MPRAGWVKPQTDQRLSDHISIGVLTRVFPPELVDRVVGEAGRREQRQRLLPARVVVYYVLGLALFSHASYEEVMRMLVDGLAWQSGWQRRWQVPTKAALFKARARLGVEPLKALFEQVAVPLARSGTAGAFYRDWRVMSVDGTCLDVADTTANEEAFGRPGWGRGTGVGAFPQIRLVGLAECGTHALVNAAIGPQSDGERTLAAGVLDTLKPDMLCLADRGLFSFELWQRARATGAELVWRTKANHMLPVLDRLADDSYRSEIYAFEDRHRHREPVAVRVVEYEITDASQPANDTRYRLLTTILEPERAPADELACSTRNAGNSRTPSTNSRSTSAAHAWCCAPSNRRRPQEAYAYLCVHYAIRWLMHTVAIEAGHDPDRLSFTRTLRVARRTTASHAGFSPSDTDRRA